EAAKSIRDELNYDTLPRLETFLGQALDWERARKADRPPSQTPEELLAFALSGWLLGDSEAEKNPDRARRLWEARQMILEGLKGGRAPGARKRRPASFAKDKTVGVALIARRVPLRPPPDPPEKTTTDVEELTASVPGPGNGATYCVQLPPEYHPNRPYPVLIT